MEPLREFGMYNMMNHRWFASRATQKNSAFRPIVSRCLALVSFKQSNKCNSNHMRRGRRRSLDSSREAMKRPDGRKRGESVIHQHCYSLSMYLILYFLLISLTGVAVGSQQNTSSISSTEAPKSTQTSSTWPTTDWSSTESPPTDISSTNSSTLSPERSIKSLVMETTRPLESQHRSQVSYVEENQQSTNSTVEPNVIEVSTKPPLPMEKEQHQSDRIASFYLDTQELPLQLLSAPVNQPPSGHYKFEEKPRATNIYGSTSAGLEELPLELLHEHESMSSGDKLLSQVASLSLNQPRQTRSNMIKSTSFQLPVESSAPNTEAETLRGQLQSSLKPKYVEPPNAESATYSSPSTESIDWSQMVSQALLQADSETEHNFPPTSSSPQLIQPSASVPTNYHQQQLGQSLRRPGKSLRQLASKLLRSPTHAAQVSSNGPSSMITSASRLIPKSIKNFFEPLTATSTRLAPLVSSGGRRAKALSVQESNPQPVTQQASSTYTRQLPPLSLVLVNGQLYSVLNHNQPSTTTSTNNHQANFDYQTSDTSEFPVFEAQSSNNPLGGSSSTNTGCNNPRHIIHADRSVVNHILESQQNFVIARVPIKKYPQASSSNRWPNSIEQQIQQQQQQQQQQLLSSQSHLYHAFPMQTLASSSPVVAAPANIRYHPPAVSIEVQASSPRPSIWQSFANFVSSFTRLRPQSSYLSEASNPSAVYSLDLPGGLYLGGGSNGRRWWQPRARRLDPMLMNAFRLLGSEPRYLEATQNRRTSPSSIDPMQRLLMLKTAYENEVCSPVAEVADKIKYSCLPNHCVASALASAAINLEQQQSMLHNHQLHQSSNLNLNDANSMLDYYLSRPGNSLTPPYVSAQSVLTNNYTAAHLMDNSPLEVLQLDGDPTPTHLPIITYTHMNAYETPIHSRLAQPQHQHFTGGSQNLETFAEMDEPEHHASGLNNGGLAQRQSVHLLSRYSNAQTQPTGIRRQPALSKTFYQTVPQQSLERPSVLLGTNYHSARRSPTILRSSGYTTTESPTYQLDWSNFAATPAKLATIAEQVPAKKSSQTGARSNKTRTKTRHWDTRLSSIAKEPTTKFDSEDEPIHTSEGKDDNEDEAKRSNKQPQQQLNQTDSTMQSSNRLDDSRARKTRRSRPQQAVPRYGLRTASLPPPEREFNADSDEMNSADEPWVRSGEEEEGSANTTDCNCDKTTDKPSTTLKVPIDARSAQLDKWRRATLGSLEDQDNSHPTINQSVASEFTDLASPHQAAKDSRQPVAKLHSRLQYNLRNTTYRNLQLSPGSPIPMQDPVLSGGSPNETSPTSTRAPTWINSNPESSSIPSDISTTTAYSSTWSPGDNLSFEQSSAQLNLSKPETEPPIGSTSSTTPSIDEELQSIRELEEPEERLSRLGTGRPRIGGFNFKPLSVNEIIAQARRENQRSNVTGPNIGAEASAPMGDKTSNALIREEEEEEEKDDAVVPHQYQIQIRTHLEPETVDEASRIPSQELALDKMKERVKDRLFEHREEEHWHEKKWLKGQKRRRLVDGKWVLEKMPPLEEEDIKNPIRLQQEATSIQEKHFAIPTPNFDHSAKFLDWVQRDVDMNEEPGEPRSYKQTPETGDRLIL